MPYTVPFKGPRLKLERAVHHINDIDSICAEFFKTHYRVVLEENLQRTHRRFEPKTKFPSQTRSLKSLGTPLITSDLPVTCLPTTLSPSRGANSP
jgi:hypothetical protein